jgi:ATP-dependent Clp protease adaptor protein ClpS
MLKSFIAVRASRIALRIGPVLASGNRDDSGEDEEFDSGLAVQEQEPELKEPGKFAVVLHNDNYTTMEFVIEILTRVFRKSESEAMEIMLRVHNEGKGVAGLYTREIADTKVAQVTQLARARGFPLAASVEPV